MVEEFEENKTEQASRGTIVKGGEGGGDDNDRDKDNSVENSVIHS